MNDPYSILKFIGTFVYLYPLYLSAVWISGAILYFYLHERKRLHQPPKIGQNPPGVSILVPCFNETQNLHETIQSLVEQNYPCFEIIAIDDGSLDGTGELLIKLAQQHEALRVILLQENMGKANALNLGAKASKYDFLVCIDGDAMLDESAVAYLMEPIINNARVAAVTGNPRIRNRSSLLGRIQVGEYSGIIGLIKRAQRCYGKIFTISGVVAAFRKSALQKVGYWSTNMATEDLDISWKLQTKHWDIQFEPRALCWILMPETLGGLIRQRSRWAQGNIEIMLKYAPALLNWKARRLWPIFIESALGVAWSFCVILISLIWLVDFSDNVQLLSSQLINPFLAILLFACLSQFFISLSIERYYEKNILRYYVWVIWFPAFYWLMNIIAIAIGTPRAIFRNPEALATWVSPDRGLSSERK